MVKSFAIIASSAIVSGWPVASSKVTSTSESVSAAGIAAGTVAGSGSTAVCTVTRSYDYGTLARLDTSAPGSFIVLR